MTFHDLLLAAQLESEERIGSKVRAHAREQTRNVSKLRQHAKR